MYKSFLLAFILLLLSACNTLNGSLDTANLVVAKQGTNTAYEPVKKEIAEKAVPFTIKYPTYIPFEHEETNVFITGWDSNTEKVSAMIRYPSTEEDARWHKNSFAQPSIPHVDYTITNFDLYYSRYSEMDDYKKVNITENLTGLFKAIKQMNGAELHWFNNEKEYTLMIMRFSDDTKKLEKELIKIAKSIK